MAHFWAKLVYRLLTKGQEYVDRGAAYYRGKRAARDGSIPRRPPRLRAEGNASPIDGSLAEVCCFAARPMRRRIIIFLKNIRLTRASTRVDGGCAERYK